MRRNMAVCNCKDKGSLGVRLWTQPAERMVQTMELFQTIDAHNRMNLQQISGGPGEDRTPDPLVANQVLSQLSYRPGVVLPFLIHRVRQHSLQAQTWLPMGTSSRFSARISKGQGDPPD